LIADRSRPSMTSTTKRAKSSQEATRPPTAAKGIRSPDQSYGNCSTASHPVSKKGRINASILPNSAPCAKSDRLLGKSTCCGDAYYLPFGGCLVSDGAHPAVTTAFNARQLLPRRPNFSR